MFFTAPDLTNVIVETKIDIAFIDDAVPAGAGTAVDSDTWSFVSSPAPHSGTLSHESAAATGFHQHYFLNANAKMFVSPGDTLYAYVYLDPSNLPDEIMLQWHDSSSSWEHRAYWGVDAINWAGTNGTASRYYMSALPRAGRWVRLEVPAATVGLEGMTVNGIAFSANNGHLYWDDAGVSGVRHDIEFLGQNYAGGNNTAYIDNIRIIDQSYNNVGGILTNHGFEEPVLAAGATVYNPTGGTWSFYGSSAIISNAGGRSAPTSSEGSQALLLQNNGFIKQSFNLFPGTYRLLYDAAQSSGNSQNYWVTYRGQVIHMNTPLTGYSTYTSDPFIVH